LLDELWAAFERLNGWNLQLGGYTPEGEDGVNRLTYECIEACRRNRFRRPNVALRITSKSPDDVLVAALGALGDGSGRPVLYNDDLYLSTLLAMDLGLSETDARELGFGGCTETMVAGLSNCGSLEGYLNLAKCLELALHDGYDPAAGRQAGPHTGAFAAFESYEAFLGAVRRQIQFATDAFVASMNPELEKRFTAGDPKLYRTLFTRDCVKRRRSFEAGGARYNWSVVSYHGIANLIDGLAAVKQCVYEEKSVRADRLVRALDANFEGFEEEHRCLTQCSRFGNDEPEVDAIGREIMEFAWKELLAHEPPRGGRYLPSCILFTTYAGAGRAVGALPDGRRAGEVLADSVGPVQGRDRRGPTAMLRSVTRLPLQLAIGTPVLNIRLQKALLESREGRAAVAAMVRSYFNMGGLQLQVSVVSRTELLEAQRDPENHADLIVRIGGYSEYFTVLDRDLQDSVIARTEHMV
jgi:formate C-acetyltransferase